MIQNVFHIQIHFFLNNFSLSFLLMNLSTYLPSLPSLVNEKLYADFHHYIQLIIGEATTKIICIYNHGVLFFNKCPFQLLRSHKRHEENKRKIGQERSSMKQADYQCHRPLHECKKVCPCTNALPQSGNHSTMNQARSEEEMAYSITFSLFNKQ